MNILEIFHTADHKTNFGLLYNTEGKVVSKFSGSLQESLMWRWKWRDTLGTENIVRVSSMIRERTASFNDKFDIVFNLLKAIQVAIIDPVQAFFDTDVYSEILTEDSLKTMNEINNKQEDILDKFAYKNDIIVETYAKIIENEEEDFPIPFIEYIEASFRTWQSAELLSIPFDKNVMDPYMKGTSAGDVLYDYLSVYDVVEEMSVLIAENKQFLFDLQNEVKDSVRSSEKVAAVCNMDSFRGFLDKFVETVRYITPDEFEGSESEQEMKYQRLQGLVQKAQGFSPQGGQELFDYQDLDFLHPFNNLYYYAFEMNKCLREAA